jgi:hypothetical protein
MLMGAQSGMTVSMIEDWGPMDKRPRRGGMAKVYISSNKCRFKDQDLRD